MTHISSAGNYLFDTILGFVLLIVLLRFWMQWVRADFRNEIGQFLILASNPLVLPLRKVIPSIGNVDTATVVLAGVVAVFKTCIFLVISGSAIPWVYALCYSLGEVFKYSIYIFMGAIFIQIIASWVNPHAQHPILNIAHSIAEPLMAPARRLIPAMGGIDFSPIVVFLFLNLSQILIVVPLQSPY